MTSAAGFITTFFFVFIVLGFYHTIKTDIKAGPPWNNKESETDAAPALDPLKAAETARQIEFFRRQLEILRRIEKDAQSAYNAAVERVKDDSIKNQYCMIIPQKLVLKHIREKDAAANRLITARNKVNNTELKIAKLIIE